MKARILAIDDQLYFRRFVEGLLAEEGYAVRTAESLDSGLLALRDSPADLVVLDPMASGAQAGTALSLLREAAPDVVAVVLTGAGDVQNVARSMREGASDYLLKPVDRDSLLRSIERALATRRNDGKHDQLVAENLRFMERLSIHERTMALLGLPDETRLSQGVLELLVVEAAARSGALWLRPSGESGLALMATYGDASDLAETLAWKTHDDQLDRRLAAGEVVEQVGETDPAVLHVPFVHDGELTAVARLVRVEPGIPPAFETAQRLAGAVLASRRPQLQPPEPEPVAEPAAAAAANPLEVAETGGELIETRSGLPTRGFLERVLYTEVQKASRFGRRLACLAIDLQVTPEDSVLQRLIEVMRGTLRTTDTLCSENARRFWVLVTDTDSLGGIVLKRRLSERIAECLCAGGGEPLLALGVASYPLDGETAEDLLETALERVETEKSSLIQRLGIQTQHSLGEVAQRLLQTAERLPGSLVPEAASLLFSELASRPLDRGLLFLAPGPNASDVLPPLTALGDARTATDVFIATDSDTVPSGASVTAVGLPPDLPPEHTWIVRFGEAPPYALIAGAVESDGRRAIYHTGDRVLVEHLTFRLRSEVGFGVRN